MERPWEDQGTATGAKDNISNHETQFDSSFSAGYEEGVIVADLMKHPKAQKYFTVDEWRDLWGQGFSHVEAYTYKPNQLVQAVARDALPVNPIELREAIEFEFDLPFPNDTLNRVDEALDAFSARLQMAI